MNDYEECKRIVRDFTKGVNTGDKELLTRVTDEDYTFHNFQGTYNNIRTAFPDMEVYIDEQVVDDDHVVNRTRMTGTHKGEFAGIPATDKKVETTGMVMFTFKGDKIHEQWAEWNIMGMLAQVGAKPMRPQDC
jgi:steroid delta-isomerase-like uncharacterized protein